MPSLKDDRLAFAQALFAYERTNLNNSLTSGGVNSNNNLFTSNNASSTLNSTAANRGWQNAQAPPPQFSMPTTIAPQRSQIAFIDTKSGEWSSFNDAVQVFTSPYHLNSLLVNVLGFGAEICALLTHLILLTYTSWQIGRRRRGRCPPDMSVGLGLHLSIVGVILATFTSTMHAFLLMKFEETWRDNQLSSEITLTSYSSPSQTISPRRQQLERLASEKSEWQMLCVYHLYIRDTLASLYLYLLVVNLAAYTKVSFPPRVPHNARWKAIFVMVHSLPWVMAIGAALPICVLNLGRGGRALPAVSVESSYSHLTSSTSPVRGMCSLNTKTDIVSTSLELFLFALPVLLCLGVGCTICCPRKPSRAPSATISAHTNHTTTDFNNEAEEHQLPNSPLDSPADSHMTQRVTYSRGIVASTVFITLVTQTPFAVIRLMISLFSILKNRYPISPIVASYISQIHLFLFASVPMLLLLAMIFLRRGYDGLSRRVEKNHVLNHDPDSEVLYTNCMLTSV